MKQLRTMYSAVKLVSLSIQKRVLPALAQIMKATSAAPAAKIEAKTEIRVENHAV